MGFIDRLPRALEAFKLSNSGEVNASEAKILKAKASAADSARAYLTLYSVAHHYGKDEQPLPSSAILGEGLRVLSTVKVLFLDELENLQRVDPIAKSRSLRDLFVDYLEKACEGSLEGCTAALADIKDDPKCHLLQECTLEEAIRDLFSKHGIKGPASPYPNTLQ